MFEKLLELFFHAKAGAFAGLILIGTTGALVTATVSSSNGVTTITLTQASASPSGSASPSASPSTSPSASPTLSASPSPSASPSASPSSSPSSSPSACTDETHAMSDAVKTVNAAFSMYHTDLTHMRNDFKSDAAKKIVEDTDKLLKSLRQNAVKDIHATSACAKAEDDDEDADEDRDEDNDDEDEDEDSDKDKDKERSSKKQSETNFIVVLFNNLFGNNTTTTTSTATSTLTTAGDPKTIADTAVAAMKLVFDDAVAKLQALPSPSPRVTKSPQSFRSDEKGKSENRGKGNSRGEREDDEDDD